MSIETSKDPESSDPESSDKDPDSPGLATTRRGRSSSLILDLFGLYIRQFDSWIAVGGLVRLMSDLGIDEGATRSALSRMVRKGLLEQRRRGSVKGYAVAPRAEPGMQRADRRILNPLEPADISDGWTIITATIPESRRNVRDRLREQLRRHGCGSLGNAIWLAPRRATDDLWAVLREFELDRIVTMFSGTYLGAAQPREMVKSAWDLDALADLYRRFLTDCDEVLTTWPARPVGPNTRAFTDYTDVVHAWRKFPYLDPGLPRSYLPEPWGGDLAVKAFLTLRELLGDSALAHVKATIESTS